MSANHTLRVFGVLLAPSLGLVLGWLAVSVSPTASTMEVGYSVSSYARAAHDPQAQQVAQASNPKDSKVPQVTPPTGTPALSPTRVTTVTATCQPRWSVVDSPNPGLYNHLNAVAAVSANDVWAVGGYWNKHSPSYALTMHWDGSRWSVVPSPNSGANDYLEGVVAVSSNDVWAVGSRNSQTLTMHWDGSRWSVVPSPNTSSSINHLNAVAAVSANDVWAVGYHRDGRGPWQTLTMHWDGVQWSVVKSPSPASAENILGGVAAMSSDDVWAVGYYRDRRSWQTLTMHWDGKQWSVVPSPSALPTKD